MADKNINSISDEELEEVAGGKGFGKSSTAFTREMKRQKKVEQLAKEAVGRMNPNDPLSWFQTVADMVDERGGIK